MTRNSTNRFSDRVSYYIRSRPTYPAAMFQFMQEELLLSRHHVIADVGSGTGILTEPLLKLGNLVHAIEPNEPMHRAAEELLAGYSNFHSIDGSAEQTTLENSSVDFITSGQAFHWFDVCKSRQEFGRILRPGGWIVLAWNDRRLDRPAFAVAYEQLVRKYNTDLDQINHRNVSDNQSDSLNQFFGSGRYRNIEFANPQKYDAGAVRARLLSSSYMPLSDDPRCDAMLTELNEAFDAHQRNGVVELEYDTRVYYGRIE